MKSTKIIGFIIFIQVQYIIADVGIMSLPHGPYITIGINISFHHKSKGGNSVGPEISFGYLFKDSIIISNSFSYLISTSNYDWIIKNKINLGYPYVGFTSGLLYYNCNNARHFGYENGLWAGFGLFGEINHKLSKHKEQFSTIGKFKFPIYLYAWR